jgi:hypothetical protein
MQLKIFIKKLRRKFVFNSNDLVEAKVIRKDSKVHAAMKHIIKHAVLKGNETPSDLVTKMRMAYSNYSPTSNSLNGAVFEAIIACSLLKNNIKPIYVQAKVVFVPNVNFDFLLYSRSFGPLSISAKTSLRERYKQADLEAVSLKYVHRKSKCYLLTLDNVEARVLIDKISKGDLLGIDDVIVATSVEYDAFVQDLMTYEFVKPEKVDIVTATTVLELSI